MAKDACYRKIKRKYKVFPSARASQAIAKCRKSSGSARKSKAGASLPRWDKEILGRVNLAAPLAVGPPTVDPLAV